MKILLIYPYFLEARVLTSEDVSVVPLGVYYVAAVLKHANYSVEVLNWHDINATPEKIKEVLAEKKPDVIGFSILHGNRWGGIEIARVAKQIDSRVTIVFGGVGATFLWEQALSHFLEFQDAKDAVRFAALCYQNLGYEKKAAALLKRFEKMR